MSNNLYELFGSQFRSNRHKVCLYMPNRDDWQYSELEVQASKAAGSLLELGVQRGDRVMVQVEKTPEAVALYLGCLKIGAVYVPINTGYTSREVAYFIEDSKPKIFVGADNLLSNSVQVVTLDSDGLGTFSGAVERAVSVEHVEPLESKDLASIVYTSGTTGPSKGAMLTHGNLASNALTLNEFWGWRSDDVLLHALPMFHVHGLFVALHCVFLGASSMVFLDNFDPEKCIEHLAQATVMMGVPTFYTRLLARKDFTKELCTNVRVFISGSAPLTEKTFEDFEERTGHKILERYGMSETLMNTSNPLDGKRIAGTVGFALPGIETRITADDGTVLPPGDIGEIEVCGPNVFAGYWEMPEKTAQEFRPDGFFRTGDMGVMDIESRVSIVGRAKDLVISGGLNVYPKEVERLIEEIPEVVECAVIGVPHPDFGEGVVAVVVPRSGEITTEMVVLALRNKLARFKQPKIVVSVETLPRNAMGKVQKNDLRERFTNLFG